VAWSLEIVSIVIWMSLQITSILELMWLSLEIFWSFEICFVIVIVVDVNNVVVD
jgi:hypothetical protein